MYEFTELEKDLYAALAVILDQINSAGPTEMIAAVFDGRELKRGRELVQRCQKEGVHASTS